MTIWKIMANEGYTNAFRIDENGKQCFDANAEFMKISSSPPVRRIRLDITSKGIPDIMNYWGTNGTAAVSEKFKALIEEHYGNLSIQFLPCVCKEHEDVKLWVLNVCEYHDVIDYQKSVFNMMHDLKDERVIRSVKKHVFTKEAFDLDIFKIYLSDRKYSTNLFVSDRFKAVMEENGVTGAGFGRSLYGVKGENMTTVENDINELCCLANSMEMIQSVTFERRLDLIEERLENVLTMLFVPCKNYFGDERLLMAEFRGVCEFDAGDLFGMIFQPCIIIEDISDRGLENIHYIVREAEGYFRFMCDSFGFAMNT